MKKSYISVAISIFVICITACNSNTLRQIDIAVKFKHLPKNTETAYLDVIKPTETICIDTTAIDPSKGSFNFQLYANNSESLYRIRINNQSGFLFIAGDRDLKINGDYAELGESHIEGSPESIELQKFISGLNLQNATLNKLEEDIQNPASPQNDSLTRIKRYRLQQGRHAILDSLLQKARTTNDPVVALFSLGILDNKGVWQKGKTIFEGLPTRFPNNELVKEAVIHYKKKLNNNGESPSISIGDQAPDLTYPDPAGKIVSLSEFKGKYVLVDFWASWCAPCREANPGLVKVYNRFKDKNFTIFGVSLDSKKSHWEKAIKKDGLEWKQISDLKGWNSAPATIYNVEAIPTNFLVNPEGKIIAKNLYKDSLTIKLIHLLNTPHSTDSFSKSLSQTDSL